MFIVLRTIVSNFLFQPLGSLPAEGLGSEGVRRHARSRELRKRHGELLAFHLYDDGLAIELDELCLHHPAITGGPRLRGSGVLGVES